MSSNTLGRPSLSSSLPVSWLFFRIRCVHLHSLPVSMCAGPSGFLLSLLLRRLLVEPQVLHQTGRPGKHTAASGVGTEGVRACFKAAVAEVVMCVPKMMVVFKTLPSKASGTRSLPSYGGGDDGDALAAIKVMTTALTLPLKVSSTRSSPCEPLTLSTLT